VVCVHGHNSGVRTTKGHTCYPNGHFFGNLSAVAFDHPIRTIVGAAIIRNGRVLACERSSPPEAAGRWEFPGGKVEPGETEVEALARECAEELGVRVRIGERVGQDVSMADGRFVLRVYAATLVDGEEPKVLEHSAMRWLSVDELHDVPWLPADAPIVAVLPRFLK
jgi:8-oxo-dGTP diphosphatase